MTNEEIDNAKLEVMIRTLDGWFLFNSSLTYDAVTAWLESIENDREYQTEELLSLEGDASEIG